MSRRFNLGGFSRAQMRRLFGSSDDETLRKLHADVTGHRVYKDPIKQQAILEIIDRAVMSGVPFPDLECEAQVHSIAAEFLVCHGQEVAWNYSTVLEDTYALEEGLCRRFRKFASPETKAFLRGLIEGTPLFGRKSNQDGVAYGMISLDRLRVFLPGVRDYAEVIAYRVGRAKSLSDIDEYSVEFAAAFTEWLTEIVAAERDLYFSFG